MSSHRQRRREAQAEKLPAPMVWIEKDGNRVLVRQDQLDERGFLKEDGDNSEQSNTES